MECSGYVDVIVTAMGLKPSPSGETFRFYNFCPFEVWNTFWLWLSFLVLRVVMRCATDWNALDNPSLINCRGRYCVRSLVRIGLQSVAHETSPNLPASAGSGSVISELGRTILSSVASKSIP